MKTTTILTENAPTIPADEYPPARRVAFESRVPVDDWQDPPLAVTEYNLLQDFPTDIVATRPYLTAMKVADHMFALQLAEDETLQATYTWMRSRRNDKVSSAKQRARNPSLHSSILTIERALRNRMDFAKHQKIFVLEQAAFMDDEYCELEKERINEDANAEIKIVYSIVKDWQSETLQQAIQDFTETVLNLMR